MHNKLYRSISLISFITLCNGVIVSCGTNKEKLLNDQNLKTMEMVYERSVSKKVISSDRRALFEGVKNFSGEAKNTALELDQLFPRLANPDLVIYIWPHSRGEAVIPGYFTKIPLYERNYFHLPSDEKLQFTEVDKP